MEDDNGDEMLKALFDQGACHSALSHDVIERGTGMVEIKIKFNKFNVNSFFFVVKGEKVLIEQEADAVAQRALNALKQSRRELASVISTHINIV